LELNVHIVQTCGREHRILFETAEYFVIHILNVTFLELLLSESDNMARGILFFILFFQLCWSMILTQLCKCVWEIPCSFHEKASLKQMWNIKLYVLD